MNVKIPDFAGNDYLGLSMHPVIPSALSDGASRYGFSYKSSRSGLGWTNLHEEYERFVESFTGFDSACILHTTYLGGSIYFIVLASLGVTDVFCDEMAHSNLQLGMVAAGIKIHKYRHLDSVDLEHKIKNYGGRGRVCIATDSIFGISGEISPLRDIHSIAEKYNAELLIDDAHGLGVFGISGRGTIEQFEIPKKPFVTVLYTMTKAMGCDGGFLCGRNEIISLCRASAIVNGGAIPAPPVANACLAVLKLFDNELWRKEKLFENKNEILRIVDELNLTVIERRGAILALLFKNGMEAEKASKILINSGIRVPYFKYASEPRDNLLRVAARSVYISEHLELFQRALKQL
jgi:7-keto-8-aminopelargonate synthetase-like enzyme